MNLPGKDNFIVSDVDSLKSYIQQAGESITQKREKLVREMLLEKGVDSAEVDDIFTQIDKVVRAKILTKYPDYGSLSNETRRLATPQKKIYKFLKEIATSYTSLASWIWRMWNIPLYHMVGDVIGYGNGQVEFNFHQTNIGPDFVHQLTEYFLRLGGINDIDLTTWAISDDSVMYLATAKCVIQQPKLVGGVETCVKQELINLFDKIQEKHGGVTTLQSLSTQKVLNSSQKLPYNVDSFGAGGAIRAGAIIYSGMSSTNFGVIPLATISNLINICTITHNSAIAILGSITVCYWQILAVAGVEVTTWPELLLKLIRTGEIAKEYQRIYPRFIAEYMRDQEVFISRWEEYIQKVFSPWKSGKDMRSMERSDLRYQYLANNFSKGRIHPGGGGDDVVIFAYDSLIRSGGSLEKLIWYACLHPGDSDTVGCIAMGWFGGYYGSPAMDKYFSRLGGQIAESEQYYALFGTDFLQKTIEMYYLDLYLVNVAQVMDSYLE